MDFAGLIGQFRTNRPLTDQEKTYRLHQQQRIEVEPEQQSCVIALNSTYLEIVDKWYSAKGTISAVCLTILIMLTTFLVGMLYIALTREDQVAITSDDMGILIFVAVLSCPFIAVAAWTLSKDAFSFTHYPLRFDRKNRMVHVFRKNGSVLSMPWDDLVFTISQVDHYYKFQNILGHVMDKDDVSIRESFSLNVSVKPSPQAYGELCAHWEFIRRYMEDGPAAIEGHIPSCLPVQGRYEPLWFGLTLQTAGHDISRWMWPVIFLALVAYLPFAPCRVFAMRTSKLPQWPADIEAASMIGQDDPYAIAGTRTGERISLFPAAAKVAQGEAPTLQ